jgi:hypothetical protein
LAAAAAAVPAGAAGGSSSSSTTSTAVPAGSTGSSSSSSSSLQLVKATARCACGRRQMHLAVKVGDAVPPLLCDKECERHGRREQIAEAFGVEDAESRAAYWDRHRSPTYSPQLLQVEGHS